MADLMRKVITGSLALGVLFLMLANVVLPFFNITYSAVITGLAPSTTQGIYLILLLTALIGMILRFLPKGSK